MHVNIIILLVVGVLVVNYIPCSYTLDITARVESCPGCSLNRLPEVKKFIYEDLPKYKDVEFKKIQGAKPELVILNEEDKEIERIGLSNFNRQQCNELLHGKGFLPEDEPRIKEL